MVYGSCQKYSNLKNGFKKAPVKRIYAHPDYRGGVSRNDIALLELSQSVPFDATTQTIDLVPNDGQCGQLAVTFGFGDNDQAIWFGRQMQTMQTQVQNKCYQNGQHKDFIVTQVKGRTVCHVSFVFKTL